MGLKLLEIGNKMRKRVVFTTKGCFKSFCDHPFLVGMSCFLLFLYRSSPFIFSMLVSASPVFICTAVLLGTLLCFGQPNMPEVEIEEKTNHEGALVKSGVPKDSLVAERNGSYNVERDAEKGRDQLEQLSKGVSLSASALGEICREGSSDDIAPLIEERTIELGKGELGNRRYSLKSDWNEGRLSDEEMNEHLESEAEKSEADSFDSERVNVDSPPRRPWRRLENLDDEGEEEDDMLDSGSDGVESSSPGASMADMMPMLDELHPLLEEEAPQSLQMSLHGSHAPSQMSPRSRTSGNESDVETENDDDLEAAEDDNDNGKDDETQDDKEEHTKPAIVWTEEDQKNLQDVGSSEIERNQRLESLILRRRERKYNSMVPEMNLIDLESSDLPFHVAPISTTRQNPFEVPQDSYDNSGLPPIPGSAPSILLPRRNPFDVPCNSSEEKPNLMGDGFQEEIATLQSREPLFSRHESFNVGPLVFAPNRREDQDVKLRPYFVPEQTSLEESSYSPVHQQSSELSDSKISSTPETESVGTVEEMEERRLVEEDTSKEPAAISRMVEVIEKCPSGDQELISKGEGWEDVSQVPQLISERKHVSRSVGHGSQCSEEELSSELGQLDKKDIELNDHKLPSLDVEDHYDKESVAQPVEVQAAGYHSSTESGERRYSKGSSSSSLSEVSEMVFNEVECEGSSMMDGRKDGVADDQDISTQTSVQSTATSSSVDDVPHKEPVYDSSPPTVRKNLSSFNSFDLRPESDLDLLPALVKRTISLIERKSDRISWKINDISSSVENGPSMYHLEDKHRTSPVDINSQEQDIISSDFSGAYRRSESQVASSSVSDIGDLPKSADNKNRGQSKEEKHPIVLERESLTPVRVFSFECQVKALHSTNKEKTVVSPNSNDVYHETNEKIISTPSPGGSTTRFYNIYEPDYVNPKEVQIPNTPVDSFDKVQFVPLLNIPDIHELDIDRSPRISSPFTPDLASGAPEDAGFRVNMQTIPEEAQEIKETDGSLSELGSDGDGSMTSRSDMSRKQVDSFGESSTKVDNGSLGSDRLPDAVDTLHVVEHRETQGTSELLVAKAIPSEGTSLHPKELLDGNSKEKLRPNVGDGSGDVKAENQVSSMGKDPSKEKERANEELVEVEAENPSSYAGKEHGGLVEVKAEKPGSSVAKKETLNEVSSKDRSAQVNADKPISSLGKIATESVICSTDGSAELDVETPVSSVGGEANAEVTSYNGSENFEAEKLGPSVSKEPGASNISSNDGSIEVKAEKLGSSDGCEASLKEDSSNDGFVEAKAEKLSSPVSKEATVKVINSNDGSVDIKAEEQSSSEFKKASVEEISTKDILVDTNSENPSSSVAKEHSPTQTRNKDSSIKIKVEKLGSSVDKRPSVKDISSAAANKPDHEEKAPCSTASVEGEQKFEDTS